MKEYCCIVAESIRDYRKPSEIRGVLMNKDLQAINGQNKLAEWAERVSTCRNSGLSVRAWCSENGVKEQTYYKWQKRLFTMAQAQQNPQFAEVTLPCSAGNVAVTVRISGAAVDIHTGADPSTVEMVLRILKSC